MTDLEIIELRGKNADRFSAEKEGIYQEYLKMDYYLLNLLEKNATHRHFKTKREMSEVMSHDFNPYNTFSFGPKNPTKCKDGLAEMSTSAT